MAQIRRKPIGWVAPAGRVFDPGGRMLVRLSNEVAPPHVLLAGFVPLCDMGGNIVYAPGLVIAPSVELDPVTPVTNADGDDVLLRGWQASVN